MTHASESGHWYKPDGTPVYEVPAKDGTMRPCTLRDARKLGLFPGVTSIIKCAAAPQLENWKQEQVLMAALTLPRIDGETSEALCARIRADSQEEGRRARDRGTAIHAAIQGHFEGKAPDEEHWPYVQGVVETLRANFGEQAWIPELPCAHPLGYGTKSDLSALAVLDFKGKDFAKSDLHSLKVYDEHAMQLAATRRALCKDKAPCAIVYVSRTEPGLAKVCHIDENELQRGWEMFVSLLAYWQAKNKYWPAKERLAA